MADPSPEMLRHGSLRQARRAPLRHAGREKITAAEVLARLLDDLDVPGALDQAEEHGGPAARLALRTLALD